MAEAEFLFDFGSPNAYLAHKVIPTIEARTGVAFQYTPILLGGVFKLTNNRSPAVVYADVANRRAFSALETERFLKAHGLTAFNRNPFFPVNTLLLMRMCTAAKLDGGFEAFVDAAFRHMWEEPKKMDDVDVARDAFAGSDIDVERLMARAKDDDVKSALIANTNAAVERGAFGAPTFFVGEEMYFGKDQLRDVEAEIMRRRADHA